MLDEAGNICVVFEYKNCLAQTVFPRGCSAISKGMAGHNCQQAIPNGQRECKCTVNLQRTKQRAGSVIRAGGAVLWAKLRPNYLNPLAQIANAILAHVFAAGSGSCGESSSIGGGPFRQPPANDFASLPERALDFPGWM